MSKKTYKELERMVADLEREINNKPSGAVVSGCTFDGTKDSEAKAAIASAVEAGMVALQGLATSAPLLEIH